MNRPGGCGGARVLGVGVATLDLILEVSHYPAEDSELRALAERRVRGGNCANSLAVLAQLGHACAWVGTSAGDAAGAFIRADLDALGIDCSHATIFAQGTSPTSHCLISRATGSRTIVHYRDLPELRLADFARVPLDGWDWAHLEGRHPQETEGMIERVRREAPDTPLSVELEKPRPGLERLLRGPRVLLLGRGYALAEGGPRVAADPGAWLVSLAGRSDAELLVLGWGGEGAWMLERGRSPRLIPAYRPQPVVDTLGAGDTLNAGVIDGLLRGLAPEAAVRHAVALAGIKCGRAGLAGLGEAARAAGLVEPGLRHGGDSGGD